MEYDGLGLCFHVGRCVRVYMRGSQVRMMPWCPHMALVVLCTKPPVSTLSQARVLSLSFAILSYPISFQYLRDLLPIAYN